MSKVSERVAAVVSEITKQYGVAPLVSIEMAHVFGEDLIQSSPKEIFKISDSPGFDFDFTLSNYKQTGLVAKEVHGVTCDVGFDSTNGEPKDLIRITEKNLDTLHRMRVWKEQLEYAVNIEAGFKQFRNLIPYYRLSKTDKPSQYKATPIDSSNETKVFEEVYDDWLREVTNV